MSEFFNLIGIKLRIGRIRFKDLFSSRFIQLVSYIIVIAIFLAGGYIFFHHLFAYLYGIPEIGKVLSFRILQTTFLTFLSMLFMSNIITALSTLYRSRELEFLFSKPLKPQNIFFAKFIENLIYSSWATLLLGLPITLAYGVATKASFSFFPLSLLSLFFFLLIPAGFGLFTLILVTKFLPQIKTKDIIFFFSLLFLVAIFSFFRWGAPKGIVLGETEDLMKIEEYLHNLGLINSPFLPNAWLAEGITKASQGLIQSSYFNLFLLLSTALASFVFASIIASKEYYSTWTTSVEAVGSSRKKKKSRLFTLPLPQTLTSDLFSLLTKDIKLFFRDPTQWSQLFILLALLSIYLGSLRNTPFYQLDLPFWKLLISFVNFSFAGYVLATLSIRFIFPAISLEGRTLWLLFSSPFSVEKLLWAKLFLSLFTSLIAAETLVIISNRFLKVDPYMMFLSLGAIFLLTISLTSLSIGLGAFYPDFRERNPGKIASNPGAILTAIVSLSTVALSISILAWPTYRYLLHQIYHHPFPYSTLGIALILLLSLNSLATFLPLKLGLKSLKHREI